LLPHPDKKQQVRTRSKPGLKRVLVKKPVWHMQTSDQTAVFSNQFPPNLACQWQHFQFVQDNLKIEALVF